MSLWRGFAAGAAVCLVTAPVSAGGPDGGAVPRLGACGFGAGVYHLPGTDGCLRLSGFVAAEVGTGQTYLPSVIGGFAMPGMDRPGTPIPVLGRSTIGADALLSADVRLPTEFGPARVFVSVRARRGPAPYR